MTVTAKYSSSETRSPCPHLVQFYETDAFLFQVVGDFLIEGFKLGEPAIVIATELHRQGFAAYLTAHGMDTERLVSERRLVLLDAADTLNDFMDADAPNRDRFMRVVGGAVASMLARPPVRRIRAYGEMVDLLRCDGRSDAAIRLEHLWNELGLSQSFALLCAYQLDSFFHSAGLTDVCATHNHICAPEPLRPDGRTNKAAETVRTLVAEIARRSALEIALRASEADARASRDDLQSFLDEAAVPIHKVNAAGIVTWANRAELDLLGYRFEEYVGRHIAEFHADKPVIDDILRRLNANETLHDYEARLRAKDGSIKHVLLTSNVQRKEGEFLSTRCFSRDITVRKRTEQERDHLITELTRTVRLNEMFAGVLGHDLRNPLNTIMMAAHTLMGRVGDGNAARPLQRLLNSATRMQRMIDQLLDFSRARMGGGIPLERKPNDLAALVRDTLEEIRVAHPTAVIELDVRSDLRGDWDANRLAQVFSNLIANAVQHGTPEAPIVLVLDGTATDVVRVTIENRGSIADDLLPILFAPFRGTHQRGARSQGLGLGLFITEQIVRAHGGSIEVRSKDGVTIFELTVPRHASDRVGVTSFDAAEISPPPTATGRAAVPPVTDEALRLLVEGIRDYAIFMLDPRGYIMSWNTGAKLIKGYAADEVIGEHFSIFYPTDDIKAGKCEHELMVAARDGEFEDLGWRLRKDGTPFWANVLITAIRDRDGKLIGFAKVTRDLTEERDAQEARRQGEERFRLLVESVEDYAIFMLDPEGNVSTWNAGAERIKGYRPDEIIGKHLSTFYPDDDSAEKAEHALRVAAVEGRFENEGWRVRKDGSRFWANAVLTALHDASGRRIGFAKITRDLTNRRQHEEERLQLARAQEAVRLRDEFLSIASHELKTPLTTLRLQLDALRDQLRDAGASVVSKLDRTQRASYKLGDLVDKLLDVSRIASGAFELQIDRVDLADLIRESVDRLAAVAAAAGCTVTCSLQEGVRGLWDRSRLDQLVTNLLANATKYAAGTAIAVTTSQVGDDAIIEVRDGGPGLPEGREAQMFGRFERAAPVRHYGGLGLGLYIVSQIAEAHGGTAIGTNGANGGACFRVTLPVAHAVKAATHA